MQNKAAKRAIAAYYILSLLLTLPLLIPIWCIDEPIGVMIYFLCFFVYTRIATSFAVRITIMPSLWKELDAEKYAAIINAKPFLANYSYKLNLDFATGNYQNAHNIINSVLLQHKNVNQRVYGHLLLCRVCFERGDYEGIKDNLAQIDNYHKYNPTLKLSKPNKAAYEFYCAFSNTDYTSACAIAEKGIDKYSKKKNLDYFVLMRQYQLAVTKRMKGDLDEAASLFEAIKSKAPKLVFSSLSQKQLEIIFGTLEEVAPSKLEITEKYPLKANKASRILLRIIIIIFCVCCFFAIFATIMGKLDAPKQENKDPDYIAQIESSIKDDYEEYQILGYFNIYTDYADETYTMRVDSLFLVESNGSLDLHTPYILNGEYKNILDVKDIQVDTLYEYEIYFTPKKVKFILTEKERNIPKDTLYYYEIDGYYFCVISISDC